MWISSSSIACWMKRPDIAARNRNLCSSVWHRDTFDPNYSTCRSSHPSCHDNWLFCRKLIIWDCNSFGLGRGTEHFPCWYKPVNTLSVPTVAVTNKDFSRRAAALDILQDSSCAFPLVHYNSINVIAFFCVHAVGVYFPIYNSNALSHLKYLRLNRSESTTLFSSVGPRGSSNQHHSSSVLLLLSFKDKSARISATAPL